MTDLSELIARVEGATGPNYALECDLFEALDVPKEWFGSKVVSHFLRNGHFGFNTADGFMHLDCIKPPPYTASLDAALALAERVLPGWKWGVTGGGAPADALLYEPVLGGWRHSIRTEAPTPALALVLAVLRGKMADSTNIAARIASDHAAGDASCQSEG